MAVFCELSVDQQKVSVKCCTEGFAEDYSVASLALFESLSIGNFLASRQSTRKG